MADESSVKVCVRVRPLIKREESAALENAEAVQLFWKADKKSIHQIDDGNSTKCFSFGFGLAGPEPPARGEHLKEFMSRDRVFTADEPTHQLYQDIAKPLVVSAVEGYNGTIFAYGQTSSGKTFTMMGSDHNPGVIPLAVEDVFETITNCPKKEFLLRVSYMEIYNETVTDLLVDSWKRKPLEVREDINKNIYVGDLTEELVTSPAQALGWIRKGEANRHYGKTKMNQRSSRSHTVFRMILESRERSDAESGENADGAIFVSHLNLVDLAGSERASQTGAEGARLKEGCNINRSLFTLGQVIKKVTDESQKSFINYRDSKITRILQNSLGGNAKTIIICTITPVTLDDTLSTLQFASTAKKMKNDPHVTEVSGDGALLKRYREEIVNLKHRLHELSSVKQTTATEKEVLAQMLQEKDQLQREQQDKIKNLTKLLVTSSNTAPVKKMPKRRVTWGGNMLGFAHPSAVAVGSSDLSFAEPCLRKRKASYLMELTEDEEEFDTQWIAPEEPSDEFESPSFVNSRSFKDGANESQDWMSELSQKLSSLERQLETESQQKEEAVTKVASLDDRVAELQQQLQMETQQKQDALEKIRTLENWVAELEKLQQTEVQQKLELTEKVVMMDLKVADLESQLDMQRNGQAENDEVRREFEETIQLCETLASEKDKVMAERECLKQEQRVITEKTELLEKENASLSRKLVEMRETEEFEALEHQLMKKQEGELRSEILDLKETIKSSEIKFQELQKTVEKLSEELKKKSDFAEELQTLSDKDLVQEVVNLRRSLNDAEGVSRDVKKEWAFLRSRNISLEEMNVDLTASQKMSEGEAATLRSQLEAERLRFKTMQSDLQKELNMAFSENTKLCGLLDGKVPKSMIDTVELETRVASLTNELSASREVEGGLRGQLEELVSLHTQKMDNMLKQLEESEQERVVLVEKLNGLTEMLAEHEASGTTEDEVSKELQSSSFIADQPSGELQQQVGSNPNCVQDDKETVVMVGSQSPTAEMEQLISTLDSLSAERDQLKMDLQENIDMMIENQEELRTAQETDREQKERIKQLESDQQMASTELEELHKQTADTQNILQQLQLELQEQSQRNVDLERLGAERQNLLEQEIQQLEKQLEEKQETKVTTLTAQMEMTVSEQDELLFEEKQKLQSVIVEKDELQEMLLTLRQERQQLTTQLQEEIQTLQSEIHSLEENLQSSTTERDALLSEQQQLRTQFEDMKETLQSEVTTLTAKLEMAEAEQDELLSAENQKLQFVIVERDELQEMLLTLKQERQQLTTQQQEELQTLQSEVHSLEEKLQSITAERDHLLSEKETICQTASDEEKLLCQEMSLHQEMDHLQETLHTLTQEKQQLKAQFEDKIETLQSEVTTLTAKLEMAEAEQDELLSAENQKLQFVIVERDELQEMLLTLKQERQQLTTQQQEEIQTLQSEVHSLEEKLQSITAERDHLLSEKETICQTASDEEKLLCQEMSLHQEMDHLQETLHTLTQEKQQLKAQFEDKIETLQSEVHSLEEKLQSTTTERDHSLSEKEIISRTAASDKEKLLCQEMSLRQEMVHLQETLHTLTQEKQQLKAQFEDNMETLQREVTTLTDKMEMTVTEKDDLLSDEKQKLQSVIVERDELQEMLLTLRQERQQLTTQLQEEMETLQSEVHSLEKKLQSTTTERDDLLSEKEIICRTSASDKENLLCQEMSLRQEMDHLQETLNMLTQEKQQLGAQFEDKMETLQSEVTSLREELQRIETERDDLLCDKVSSQSAMAEKEELLCRVTSLSEEKDQLEETLHTLGQETQQLKALLEDKMEMVTTLTEKMEMTVTEKDDLLSEEKQKLQSVIVERDELQEMLLTLRQERQQLTTQLQEKMETLQSELPCETNTATVSSHLHDSTEQLQESFRGFQDFMDTCSRYISTPIGTALKVQCLRPLPKTSLDAYATVCQQGLQIFQSLTNIPVTLRDQAQDYRKLCEELVKADLAVFEERRLQDVLLCRAQAPTLSVNVEDFHSMWGNRLTELLNKRRLYQTKISSILEILWANMDSYPTEFSAEIQEMERFNEQLQVIISSQPMNQSQLDGVLKNEMQRRAAAAEKTKTFLQAVTAEHSLCEELSLHEAQAFSHLSEERSKSATLLQVLDGTLLKDELSLLKNNQEQLLQLQQSEGKARSLQDQIQQLQEGQVKANNRVSDLKEATQLLQTELQDCRAQKEEKERAVQTLSNKLQEYQKSSTAVELEALKTKLFKMEVELSSADDKHQQEINRMTTVLKVKEDSLRNLKEALRRSQQGEESILQGEELHAKITKPRCVVNPSIVLQEKAKLEEEVKRLKLEITELNNLVSNQRSEISKWNSRAIKLKAKSKTKVDAPSSPCTPTKRGPPLTSDSSSFQSSPKKVLVTPRKILDSPRRKMETQSVSVLNSPKYKFFDVGGSSEVLSRTFPRQFFDNSSLGTVPDQPSVQRPRAGLIGLLTEAELVNSPDVEPAMPCPSLLQTAQTTATSSHAAAGAEWFPQSPKQEDMCKTQ